MFYILKVTFLAVSLETQSSCISYMKICKALLTEMKRKRQFYLVLFS